MKRIRVAILFGGKSAEHEVSLQSAKNIIEALDPDLFEPVLIGIDKSGRWHLSNPDSLLFGTGESLQIGACATQPSVTLLPGASTNELVNTATNQPIGAVDVVFPVLHGPQGEDGTIQGLLRLANMPFVGAGVLGSAIGMDKDVAKRLLRDAGIAVANFLVFTDSTRAQIRYDEVVRTLGTPCFIKPANMGSSVGVSKVSDEASLYIAIENAFRFDTKVLIEAAVAGDEVECAVLGNDQPIASLPGKVIAQSEFYSYEAKYIDENGAILEIPAVLSAEVTKKVQEVALRTFKVLACEGMARVDVFVTPSGEAVVNEINTIPGFTKISMYPKLWEVSGLPYTKLITRLIELALERHERQKRLKTTYL